MEEAITQIVLSLLIWIVFFLIIIFAVVKNFISEKRIQPKTKIFADAFYNDLQIFI
jgi:hypothetical protein